MTTSTEPLAWMLVNVQTGKADTTKAYVRQEAAVAGAKAQSNQWRQFVAAPVFLYPTEVAGVLGWLDERGRNSTSYGAHADAYEIAARRLRKALGLDEPPVSPLAAIADALREKAKSEERP